MRSVETSYLILIFCGCILEAAGMAIYFGWRYRRIKRFEMLGGILLFISSAARFLAILTGLVLTIIPEWVGYVAIWFFAAWTGAGVLILAEGYFWGYYRQSESFRRFRTFIFVYWGLCSILSFAIAFDRQFITPYAILLFMTGLLQAGIILKFSQGVKYHRSPEEDLRRVFAALGI